MQCPVDNETLVMTDRSGVEIDYCPKCRGVWLDRGELDKLIERSAGTVAPPPQRQPTREEAYRPQPYRRKKESFLSDIFDF
ncbi:MAG: zf-TFIIB domain-containing protein [Alphaproteobacteria bacterium]